MLDSSSTLFLSQSTSSGPRAKENNKKTFENVKPSVSPNSQEERDKRVTAVYVPSESSESYDHEFNLKDVKL